ncbi:hypothetical protein C8R43DRAFT_1132499 [Mycena crocata]|nr:hypothetical protein C8R43DRAFT_1132499 [Mycena crocata]
MTPEINSDSHTVYVPTHPFADGSQADVILRSSDDADFYVQRGILSLVSPIFQDMFSLPQPESVATIPVIDLTEESSVLDRALRFFYPGVQPTIATLAELKEILEILISKYGMDCVIPAAKRHLQSYSGAEPLAVYAVAIRYQWKDVALVAAKECLKLNLRALDSEAAKSPALGDLSAVAYHNLLHFHFLCGAAASQTLQNLRWLPAHSSWVTSEVLFGCYRCTSRQKNWTLADGQIRTAPQWFEDFVNAIGALLIATPVINISEKDAFYDAINKARCVYCPTAYQHLIQFGDVQLSAKIREETDKIELKF